MPLRSVPTVIPRYTKLFLLPTKNWLLSFKGIENLFRLSRDDLQSYFKNSQKLNEIENYINALEPTGDPQRLQVRDNSAEGTVRKGTFYLDKSVFPY